MAKKRLSKTEKEKRLKRALAIGAAVFLVAALTAIVLGVVLSRRADENEKISYEYLRQTLIEDYLADPWDELSANEARDAAEKREGALWAVFEALMCVEDDGMRTGSKGIQYETGGTLCVDLTAFSDPALRRSVEYFFMDYCQRKDLTFRTGTLEGLKEEGKIDAEGPDVYIDGCLLTVGMPSRTDDGYAVEFFFYFNSRFGRGATVRAVRTADLPRYIADHGDPASPVSDDGVWSCFIEQTLIT